MKTYNEGRGTVLRAEELPKHVELPDGWSRSMGWIHDHGGPWPCPEGHPSLLYWRCSICGKDLLD